MTRAFDATKDGTVLAPGVAGRVLVDLSFPRGAKLPRRLTHRISIVQRPPSPVVATTYLAAPTGISKRRAIVVAPPLRGPGWVVGNGCCAAPTSHRSGDPGDQRRPLRRRALRDRLLPARRRRGRSRSAPTNSSRSYPYFGAEVLSATAGRVVGVVDRLPDGPISFDLPPITAADAGGNHVVVAVGHGRYAFYAHLQPGSVQVEVGDRVRPGQLLGLLGNSGNSNAPHLHFQLMAGPVPLGSNGIPFRFSRFRAEGTLTNFAPLLVLGVKAKIDPRPLGVHRAELPLDNEVIGFD